MVEWEYLLIFNKKQEEITKDFLLFVIYKHKRN